MKSVIFSFFGIILGTFIAFMLYSASQVVEVPVNTYDELFVQHESAFLNDGDISVKNRSQTQLLSIGYADLIVFPSIYLPPKVKDGVISLDTGIYLFGLSDPFHEYVIRHKNFSIDHVANGIYIVDTTSTDPRIYSLTAYLRVTILNGDKARTTVDVFPSEHFVFDPSLGDNYDGIDVFRVGQLAKLEIVNFNDNESVQKLGSSSDKMVEIINEYKKFQRKRTAIATEVVKKFDTQEEEGLLLLEKYGSFLINTEKRKVILKNSLISLAQGVILHDTELCKDNCLKGEAQIAGHAKKVKERLDSLSEIDSKLGEESKNILRRYISLASMISTDRNTDYYTKGGSIIVTVYQNVFQKVSSKGAYRLLTELYSQYFFPKDSAVSESTLQLHLEKSLKDYVLYLVNTKSMKEDEFIGFVYFLKEFLSSSKEVNGATIELFSQIISISSSYISTIDNESMKFQGLSVVYYTFSNIGNRLYDNLISRYFTTREGKLYIKSEYLSGTEPNLPAGFMSAIDKSLKSFGSFSQTYGSFFEQRLNTGGSSVIDSKALSEGAFDKLKQLQDIVLDYQVYLVKASLKEGGGSGLGPRIENDLHTPETVKNYFSQFKGVDISSFAIANDPKVDGYYRITISVDGRRFRFAYLPDSTEMKEVIFLDIDGKFNQIYRSQVINLDDKKELGVRLNKSESGKKNPKRYDFSYFFENTFYPQLEEVEDTQIVKETREEMSPEMKRFVSFDLLKKDFTYTEDILPLGISNIFAKIEDGAYVIKIFDANMIVSSNSLSFRLVFSSDYIYNSTTNAFNNIKVVSYVISRPKDPMFNGTEIQVFPKLIPVNQFSDKVVRMADYVNLIRAHYQEGMKNIVIDLDSNRIELDGTYYVLPNK